MVPHLLQMVASGGHEAAIEFCIALASMTS